MQLSKEVESQTGVTISRDTIRRTLQRNGMHGCRPRKKHLLKPRHHKAHLKFARAHADKDEDYWDSILWSDETKINVFGTDGFKTVWRRKGEEYKEKCMVPTVKQVWWQCPYVRAAWVLAGVGELHFIDGIMNSQMYCSILKEEMLLSLRCPWSSCTFPTWPMILNTHLGHCWISVRRNRVKVIQRVPAGKAMSTFWIDFHTIKSECSAFKLSKKCLIGDDYWNIWLGNVSGYSRNPCSLNRFTRRCVLHALGTIYQTRQAENAAYLVI